MYTFNFKIKITYFNEKGKAILSTIYNYKQANFGNILLERKRIKPKCRMDILAAHIRGLRQHEQLPELEYDPHTQDINILHSKVYYILLEDITYKNKDSDNNGNPTLILPVKKKQK